MPKTQPVEEHDHDHEHVHGEHVHGENCAHGQKPITVAKVGRNDPCPCSSGKKYKKCCGAAK